MLTNGAIFCALGLIYAGLKYYVVRDVSRDPFEGGVPVFDFVLFPPMPIAFGLGCMLQPVFMYRVRGLYLVSFALYVVLAMVFLGVLVREERIGAALSARLGAGAAEPDDAGSEVQHDDNDAEEPPA